MSKKICPCWGKSKTKPIKECNQNDAPTQNPETITMSGDQKDPSDPNSTKQPASTTASKEQTNKTPTGTELVPRQKSIEEQKPEIATESGFNSSEADCPDFGACDEPCSCCYDEPNCGCQTTGSGSDDSHLGGCQCDNQNSTNPCAESINLRNPMPYLWYPTENSIKQIEYVRRIEREFAYLQEAFLTMTANNARMQFRLRQLIRAAPCEREALLAELERLAMQEADHIEEEELPRIQRDLHCMGDIRRKQSCIMEKLHNQLTELSVAAEKEGEVRICSCDPKKREQIKLKMTVTLSDPPDPELCGCYYEGMETGEADTGEADTEYADTTQNI